MTRDHLLVIDQGTTSTRAVVYDDRLSRSGRASWRSCRPILVRAGSSTIRRRSLRSVGSQVTGALDDRRRDRRLDSLPSG